MFNLSLGKFLDSLDHAAKETFEEPPVSATALRSKRKEESESVVDNELYHDDDDDDDDENDDDDDLDNEDDDDQDRETDDVVSDLLKDEQQQEGHTASSPSTPNKNSAGIIDTQNVVLDACSESAAATDSIQLLNVAEQPIVQSHDSIDPSTQAVYVSGDGSGASPLSISKPSQDSIPISSDRPTHTSPPSSSATTSSIETKNEGGSSRGSQAASAEAIATTSKQQLEAERSLWKSEKVQLKKAGRKMRQEIEELNRECLELETQSKSLKSEVKEAWDNYNKAQEKAVFRESELHDEVKQLQKAKLLDKQHLLSQITKTNEDLSEAMKQVAVAQTQRDDMQLQLNEVQQMNLSHQDKLNALKAELIEAKNGSMQGVQSLREELRVTKLQNEQMQHDNSSLLRHSQMRQAELEEENASLSETIGRQQSEITRLTQTHSSSKINSSSSSQRSGDDIEDMNHRDRAYFALQQEVQQLHSSLEAQKVINVELERNIVLLEREVKAAAMSMDDERKRSEGTIAELTSKLADVENAKILKNPVVRSALLNVNSQQQHRHENEASIDDVEADTDGSLKDYDTVVKELQEFRVQAQNLSKLLLKKQGTVMELQAEKSALKSRLTDMESKLWTSEQQLVAVRAELDGAGEEDDDMHGSHYSGQQSSDNLEAMEGLHQFRQGSDSDNRSLRSRASSSSSSSSSRTTKVNYDLEKIGVKPSLGVTRAVNMIDAWTIVTGRFLRNYPLARLGFVLYLLVLHSWVLVVLVIKTHSLELDTDPHQHISSGNLRASHVMN